MSIGVRLRSIRTELGLSQEAMSERFGLGVGGWKRLEKQGRTPKDEVLTALVAEGIDLNWLLTGVGEMRRDASTRLSPPATTDHRLMGRLTEGIARVFKDVGQAAALRQIAERAAQYHDRIVSVTADPDDRLIEVGTVLAELRQELRDAAAKPHDTKRLA